MDGKTHYKLDATLTPEGSLAGRAFKWGFFVTIGVACALPVIFVLGMIAMAFFWGFMGGV